MRLGAPPGEETGDEPGDERGGRLRHAVLAVGTPLLLVATPWVTMYRVWPSRPGWADLLHAVLGLLLLAAALAFALWLAARRRLLAGLPCSAAAWRRMGQELAGLVRLRVPASEAGGLFSLFETLLLLTLLTAGGTGAAWLGLALAGAGDVAMDMADLHAVFGLLATALMLLHALAVALHLRDFF